jgi:hypothetical protein
MRVSLMGLTLRLEREAGANLRGFGRVCIILTGTGSHSPGCGAGEGRDQIGTLEEPRDCVGGRAKVKGSPGAAIVGTELRHWQVLLSLTS